MAEPSAPFLFPVEEPTPPPSSPSSGPSASFLFQVEDPIIPPVSVDAGGCGPSSEFPFGVMCDVCGHVIQDEGTDLLQRGKLNFKGIGVTAADNPGTAATDVTILGGHIIQEEGVSLPQEAKLNFIGDGVTATDNPGTGATDVTIPGGGTAGCVYYVNLAPGAAGNFTIAHGAGAMPVAVIFECTAGVFWFQNTYYDDVNLFLVASDDTAAGRAKIFLADCGNTPELNAASESTTSFTALCGFVENGGGFPVFRDPRVLPASGGYQVPADEIISQTSVTVLTSAVGPFDPRFPVGGSIRLEWVTDPAPLSTSNIGTAATPSVTVPGDAAPGTVYTFDPFVVPSGYYVALRITDTSGMDDCGGGGSFCYHYACGVTFRGIGYKWQES